MSKNNDKKSLFWTSYSDLMTSLFFAILVLFVVVVVAMGASNRRVQVLNNQLNDALKKLEQALDSANVTIEQQKQLLNLSKQFQTLTASTCLDYDSARRIFYVPELEGVEIFNPNEYSIKENYTTTVDKVGKDIKNVIDSLKSTNADFKFQLVIEGYAAIPYRELKAKSYNPDNEEMYLFSYQRALALYKRWKKLKLRDGNTEIIIAGSGFNGINRDLNNENNNKRFVIQIIPKIAKPKDK